MNHIQIVEIIPDASVTRQTIIEQVRHKKKDKKISNIIKNMVHKDHKSSAL